MTKDQLIRDQATTIVQLQKQIDKLRKENAVLRQALRRDLEVQTVFFRDISDKLEALEKPILQTIIDLCNRYERPVSYPEIIKAFTSRYPYIEAKPPTIRRRVRKLRETGWLIKQGTDCFYPNIRERVQLEPK